MKQRLWTLLLALVSLALVGLIYLDNWKTRQIIEIPMLTRDVARGTEIGKADLKWVQVGRYHLEELGVASSSDQVIDHYALTDLRKSEVLLLKDLGTVRPAIQLKDQLRFGALTVATDYVSGVGGFPRPGDWVRIKVVLKEGGVATVLEQKALDKVKVMAVQDKSGRPYEGKRDGIGSEPAFVTFDVDANQQNLLLQGLYSGKLHMVLIPER